MECNGVKVSRTATEILTPNYSRYFFTKTLTHLLKKLELTEEYILPMAIKKL